jgi:peptidyl-prolyl cis-trans isomerase SurA
MRRLAAVPLLAAVALSGAASGQVLLDGIAAQVGSDVVLVSEVREAAAATEARARAAGAGDAEILALYGEVLEQIIERALIQQVVRRAEIGASDADVDQAIAGIAQENGITVEKLRASVEAQGMPYSIYREKIRAEIEHVRVINDLLGSKTRVEEKEVRAIYDAEIAKQPKGGEESRLRVLVLAPQGDEPGVREAACAELDAARARIAGGEDFETVATALRETVPGTNASQAWVHETELAGWMRATVPGLPVGGLSERIDTDFGCGLVQVVDRRAFVPLPNDKARDKLQQALYEERLAEEYKKLIAKLRAQTYIERRGVFAEGSARARSIPRDDRDPGF